MKRNEIYNFLLCSFSVETTMTINDDTTMWIEKAQKKIITKAKFIYYLRRVIFFFFFHRLLSVRIRRCKHIKAHNDHTRSIWIWSIDRHFRFQLKSILIFFTLSLPSSSSVPFFAIFLLIFCYRILCKLESAINIDCFVTIKPTSSLVKE